MFDCFYCDSMVWVCIDVLGSGFGFVIVKCVVV